MLIRRIVSIMCLLAMSLPTLVSARDISSIVDPATESISRAVFIGWSLESLGIPHDDDTCALPFPRFPRGMHRTLCAAEEHGLFTLFRSSRRFTLGRPITRGEALMVVTALTRLQESADVSSFVDVVSGTLSHAVQNAIARRWMSPVRSSYFGTDQLLRGREALTLLQAVSTEEAEDAVSTDSSSEADTMLPRQRLLMTIWQLLQREYLRADAINADEAGYKAAEAMVESLGDPYTTFFRPENAEDFSLHIKGEVDGIGAQVEIRDATVTVIAPLPGSPAEKAGIRPGDRIIDADGQSLLGMKLEKAVQFIRGPRGSTVRLTIERGAERLQISVVRDTVSIPEIDVSWQGDIAIVKLVQFGETTDRRFRSIMQDIAARNPRGVVLDLRSNGGGLLHAAGVVMSAFVPRSTVFARVVSRDATDAEETTDDPILAPSTKVVTLVDSGSASASEIVAGALQDLRRGSVVGAQTFGKGTVQQILSFPDGEALKITTAEWHTPQGRSIDRTGITPDIIVDTTDKEAALERAIGLLR